MSHRAVAILAALALSTGIAQRSQPPGDPQIVLRSTAQEVLLDFIARDKHQKLVTDLRPEDIDILEDGVPQSVRSFRYRDGPEEHGRQDGPVPPRAGGGPRYAPLSQINVVSLVFEGLGPASRPRAAQAAKDFLANKAGPNTYIGVFALNQRLALLQQYTNDVSLLNRAVDRAKSGAYPKFAKDIEAEVTSLNRLGSGGPSGFSPIRPGSAEERGPDVADQIFAPVERAMAAMTIAILSSQAGNLSIDALHQLIRAQAQLPGRKTIIYFSEGLILPPEQPELFRAVISDANRSNIAFYTVDASGLDTMSSVKTDRLTMLAIYREGGPAATPNNYKENLRFLAEDTGGFSIANTNDLKSPLRRVMEEVRAHYEVAYAPTSSNYDGHFRTIEIRARRPGLRLQSRQGYFALPMLDGETLAPFEFAALTALNNRPLAQAFDFHTGILTFRAAAQATECRAVFSVPSRALHFTENSQAKLFHIHVSFLGLVKDEQDQVVRKISRDLLFQAPASKRPEFERGEVTVTLPLRLQPGRYRLEAVANDRDGEAASTRRIAFVIPSAEAENTDRSNVALSDLVFVRSLQPTGEDRDATDPLEFSGGKVTPEMNATIPKTDGAVEGVYFVVYPGPDASPDVRIAISHHGELMTSARLSLPPAEADGSLKVLSWIPFKGLDAGVYEIAVTAAQGGATARRTMAIEVGKQGNP
jgi:VWFA-related protein